MSAEGILCMVLNEYKNDCKRLLRRELESLFIRHRINVFRTGWNIALYDDGNGNRITNPRWMDYVGTGHYYRFKTCYSNEPKYHKDCHRYRKKKQYLIEQMEQIETNCFLVAEITADCRVRVKRKTGKY